MTFEQAAMMVAVILGLPSIVIFVAAIAISISEARRGNR
jgi:hypothetical protein